MHVFSKTNEPVRCFNLAAENLVDSVEEILIIDEHLRLFVRNRFVDDTRYTFDVTVEKDAVFQSTEFEFR